MSILNNHHIEELYNEITSLINIRKVKTSIAVNYNMVSLYWEIGQKISKNILNDEKPEYGQYIVEEISNRLTQKYGRGYTKANIYIMLKFYQKFQDFQKVVTLSQQLTWSHFTELLPIEDDLKRDFYVIMCYNEGWNVRTLRERKKSMLYERTAISKKPEETIKNELMELYENSQMSVDLFFRDPIVLDFLELQDTYSEKDLENAILIELEKFILEMGSDFAFMARQMHFVLDNKDYFMDLLFFHRGLRRLVLIELKLGEFEPEYKGQVELYLRWLNKYERNQNEESPIALILCAEKSQEMIELLELDQGSIHVAQYLTKMPPKELLEAKLLQAISNAKTQLEQRKSK